MKGDYQHLILSHNRYMNSYYAQPMCNYMADLGQGMNVLRWS